MNDITTVQNQLLAQDAPVLNPEKYSAAVFEGHRKLLAKAKREAGKAETYDIATTAGMARAKELRASFRDIRTGAENTRKERKAPIIMIGKLIDAKYKELEAEIEPYENRYDREIKDEEARKAAEKARKEAEERARVEAIENRIANIRNAPGRVASADSAVIKKEIDQWTLLRLDPADFQEYLEDALTAVNTTLEQLETLLAAAQAREAEALRVAQERAELARLRAEQEAREQAEREAAAERERLARVEREAIAAEKARMEAEMADMRRQMEAMRAAANPPPAAAPVVIPIEEGHTGTIIGAALVSHGQPGPDAQIVEEWINDVPAVADLPQTTDKGDVNVVPRPSDEEIVDLLANHFTVYPATVLVWLRDLVKGLEA